jgi:hypothetical protein
VHSSFVLVGLDVCSHHQVVILYHPQYLFTNHFPLTLFIFLYFIETLSRQDSNYKHIEDVAGTMVANSGTKGVKLKINKKVYQLWYMLFLMLTVLY